LSSKNKILYFTSRIPFPLEKGDKLRAYHQIKHLSKDFDVVLCSISDIPLSENAELELGQYTSNIHVYQTTKLTTLINMIVAGFYSFPFQVGYFFNTGAHYFFNKVIEEEKPDHIFVQLLRMAEYALSVPNIPKSLDYMDAFSKGIERRMLEAKGLKKLIFKIEYNRLKKYEENIFDHFNNSFIISKQDKESFSFSKAKDIIILPNGVDDEFFTPNESKPKKYDLVFTGNMSYPPNVSAVVYIAEKIMPLLIKQKEDIKFLIAGATPSASVKALQNENITVSGWLDDIRDAYNESSVFLAPLQIGTGLQNKLLEAMAMKIPCITSSLANNAIGAAHNSNIFIGNTPEEYAELVIDCLTNKEKAKVVAEAGKLHVTQNFNWPALSNELSEILFPISN
jgi:sugar transferase (PEP-CTERM/EpsH1 system associated)